jgi:uncharacterized protein YbjQ (UPF0145 family)
MMEATREMIIVTTFNVEGHNIVEYKGLVRGITVRTPNIAQGFVAGLKSITGGRVSGFTKVCEEARQDALEHMIEHAQQMGANAILGIRYDASDMGQSSATEVLCYGTAVVLQSAD